MNRLEFIERYRHELGGMILDAATAQRTGADLSMALRHVMRTIDSRLGEMYDALRPSTPPTVPAKNGPAATQGAKK